MQQLVLSIILSSVASSVPYSVWFLTWVWSALIWLLKLTVRLLVDGGTRLDMIEVAFWFTSNMLFTGRRQISIADRLCLNLHKKNQFCNRKTSCYIIDAMIQVFFSCFNAVIKILNQIYDWENSIFFKRIVLK